LLRWFCSLRVWWNNGGHALGRADTGNAA
jgi:hypothetical protein